MRKTALLFCSAIVCAAGLLMVTCSKSDNPAGPGDASATWTYTSSGNMLIISHPQTIETWCFGNQMYPDTTPAYTDTITYTLSAGQDSLRVVPNDDPQDTMVLVRAGTGTGIQGQWLMNMDGVDVTMDIGQNTITVSICPSDIFMAEEAQYIENNYNATVTKVSCASVHLTGDVSGEIVTVTMTQSGNSFDNIGIDMTFTSSVPAHTASTVFANPTTCPNNAPDWFQDFLDDNASPAPTPKRAAPPAMKLPKLRLFR